ncbi:MAG TPA: metallophosphatase [Balneolales bacterium]|nr:metallophosphatase [Balneolales bacterium]
MDRKTFIKKSLIAGMGWGLVGKGHSLFASSDRRITILHTNDTHSHLDPFPVEAGKYAGLGGIARRATIIKKIRSQNPHTLLLDAGDAFQGTPYFQFYKGFLSYKMMSKLGYDASTLGNHEFDYGVKNLTEAAQKANFPLVCANYNFTNTSLGSIVRPFIVRDVNGIQIGIFGLGVKFKGLVSDAHHKGIYYQDPVEASTNMVRILREMHKCDMVICLSHLGFDYKDDRICDKKLARQVNGIDLIIGGHTHTFLPKPYVVQKANNNPTIVTQVGFGGIELGRIDFIFDRTRHIKHYYSSELKIEGPNYDGSAG